MKKFITVLLGFSMAVGTMTLAFAGQDQGAQTPQGNSDGTGQKGHHGNRGHGKHHKGKGGWRKRNGGTGGGQGQGQTPGTAPNPQP